MSANSGQNCRHRESHINGPPPGVWGDLSGVWGGVWGDLSDVRGDLSDCDITPDDRKNGINVLDLICE